MRERITTDARLRLGFAPRRRRLLPPAVSSRRSPPPSLTLASAERWLLIHARRSAPLLVALLVGGVTVGQLRQHSGALLIEPPIVSTDGRAPLAPAPSRAMIRRFGRVGEVCATSRGGSPLSPPASRTALLPPLSPSGLSAPYAEFYPGGQGVRSSALRLRRSRCARCARLAAPLRLSASPLTLRGLRPLPRRVRARCAARPRRLVPSDPKVRRYTKRRQPSRVPCRRFAPLTAEAFLCLSVIKLAAPSALRRIPPT